MKREKRIITIMVLAIAACLFWGPAYADELQIYCAGSGMEFKLTGVEAVGISLAKLMGDYQKGLGNSRAEKNAVLKEGTQVHIVGTYKPFPNKETTVQFDFTIAISTEGSVSFEAKTEGYSGGGTALVFRAPSSPDDKKWGIMITIPCG